LLERLAVNPPLGAAAVIFTLHVSVPAPENEAVAQLRELSAAVAVLWPEARSWTATVWVTVPALAVRVAIWAAFTPAMVAVKETLDVPAGTVTEAGTVRAALLLVKLTLIPPLGAAALRATEQASVPVPVKESLEHVKELSAGAVSAERVPVPFKPIESAPSFGELVVTVSWPLDAPVEVGEKLRLTL